MDQTYDDLFNSIGLCTSVTVFIVSFGKLITENYFYYIMIGVCVTISLLTIYDRARRKVPRPKQPDFLKEYKKTAKQKVPDIKSIPCEKAIKTMTLCDDLGSDRTSKLKRSPGISLKILRVRRKSLRTSPIPQTPQQKKNC